MPSPSLLYGGPGRAGFSVIAMGLALQTVPWRVAGADADAFLERDGPADRLARGVAENLAAGVRPEQFDTGYAGFDEEWVFGSSFMAAMGFGNLALQRPDERARWAARMGEAIEPLLEEAGVAFDARRYGKSGLAPAAAIEAMLADDGGHAAYLGYTNLALSLYAAVEPRGRHAELNRRFTEALARRFAADPTGLVETFDDERYPVDNAAGIASIGLYDRLHGTDHQRVLDGWEARVDRDYRGRGPADKGLLVQFLGPPGRGGVPRGSGTLLASWFLVWSHPALSRSLYDAAREQLYGEISGYGLMREYARGIESHGDVDSGPIILGYGVSATGFALGPARAWGDAGELDHLYATAHLFGGPVDAAATAGATRHYATGGPLGDAILFAMMTTPRFGPDGAPLDEAGARAVLGTKGPS
jgi:hypothetical protein